MKEAKIFYSWQSDSISKYNRYFIEECLKASVKRQSKKFDLTFVVDRDTKDMSGTPDIISTIFKKIDEAQLFICDVSFINPNSVDGRLVPNPNVLIELGYAAAKKGWDNIVCLFNSAYGDVTQLPFDIRSRRILVYNYSEKVEKKDVKPLLINTFDTILSEIDIEKINSQEIVEKVYKNEPENIKRIALQQSNYWEFELLSKLIESRTFDLKYEIEKIEKGLILSKSVKMTTTQFLDWFMSKVKEIESVLSIVNKVYNGEIQEALGEYGKSGDAVKIKRIADIIYQIYNALVEIESELKSMILSQSMNKVKLLMEGWAIEFIDKFQTFEETLKRIYTGNYKNGEAVNIKINIDSFTTINQLKQLLYDYSRNPELLFMEDR